MNPFNQNDISTIISIVPIEIREFKPGLYPGNFNIPACLDQKVPVIFYIGTSNHVVSIANQKNPLRVETPSYRVAESIVNDYLGAQIGLDTNSKPGIVFFQGKLTIKDFEGTFKEDDVRFGYKSALEVIKSNQKNWADNLFKMADNDWNKYKNHRAISDLARTFAKIYGLSDKKEWMIDASIENILIDCPRCYSKIDARASICSACSCIINPEKDKEFKVA